MLTTREIGAHGFAGKAALELSNTDQKRRGLLVGDEAILALRHVMAERLNLLARAHGLELHADPRSYADRGIDLEPTRHVGVHAVAMERQAKPTERGAEHEAIRSANAARILERPELVLDLLTQREAVFTRRDIARELHRYLDDPEQFRTTLARLEASPELVVLETATPGGPARFSTREMIAVEERMMRAAADLATTRQPHAATARAWDRLQPRHSYLSAEQQDAVAHVTGREQIAAIAGVAGAGKSAALAAAREAWEAAGYRVRGAALAGKAAEGLQYSSGIESRTLHALEYGWRKGRDPLTARDVLVLDEAGMVGSRQMGRVLAAARAAGAKVVLVGDARQLQPIEAGAAFRAIVEQIGVAEIETVRRQREAWARDASQAFARGDVAAGLAAYAERGHVHLEVDRTAAKAAIVRDYLAAGAIDGSSLIVAHTNADVQEINQAVRAERLASGDMVDEVPFQANRGLRQFAEGDRLVFLRNDSTLGVKNGTLATVERAASGVLLVRLDGGGQICIDQASYTDVDHGYAVTLHKAQGVTVDRAYVLASGGMDRHLIYVGLTRHRETAALYGGRDEFADLAALAARLGRARTKQSTLDYAERRGIETEQSWLENTRAWMVRGKERLTAVWARAEQVLAVLREPATRSRSEAEQETHAECTPVPGAEPTDSATPQRDAEAEQPISAAERLRAQLAKARTRGPDDAAARQKAVQEALSRGSGQARTGAEQLRDILRNGRTPTSERGQERDSGLEFEK